MQPTPLYPDQFDEFSRGETPAMREIGDGIFSVPVPFGDAFVRYTLTYVFLDSHGDAHVLDPGAGTEQNFQILSHALDSVGAGVDRISTITISHLHVDHFGGAARLARASGAPVVAHAAEIDAIVTDARSLAERDQREAWGVPADRWAAAEGPSRPPLGDVADLTFVAAGPELAVPGRRLVPLHTPGHTTGHLCIDAPDDGMLFTGDHVLPVTRPGYALGAAPAGNGLVDYLDSLDVVSRFDRSSVHPAHEYSFTGLAERCAALTQHHLTRADEVAAVFEREPAATVWDVASQVRWTVGWENLAGYHLRLALLQTACHVDRLRALDQTAP